MTDQNPPAQAPGTDRPAPDLPVTAPTAVIATATATTDAADASAAPRRRGRVLTLVGAAVVVLAVAGGSTLTVLTVGDADRTVRADVWGDPVAQKQRTGGTGKEDLRKRLLPVPEEYGPGPDIDEFGNDDVIGGRQAVARLKAGVDDLPARQRESQRKAIDKLKVKGLAMRSYSADSSDLVVEIQLAQLENRQAGRDLKSFRTQFLRALGVFTKGPTIKGHRTADCFRAPQDKDTDLGLLICNAYEDDLMVSATAYGPKSLDTKAVASLVAQQLDHISSRGELV
ncbi:hypothetical protein GTW43_06320 [Streptomyces sp. SID5785]|uniref:hypothetical protein n=1 Tax=Streptomyces sp. SID5785 TaxID=2690309 RepID=UPI001360F75D|nr:hypothetical protein [Streptomyces sp. SID5785]MZD04700.1 hypothetical protein [Streptomyces sp. SID5785]